MTDDGGIRLGFMRDALASVDGDPAEAAGLRIRVGAISAWWPETAPEPDEDEPEERVYARAAF